MQVLREVGRSAGVATRENAGVAGDWRKSVARDGRKCRCCEGWEKVQVL
jgi:hypothetical protein